MLYKSAKFYLYTFVRTLLHTTKDNFLQRLFSNFNKRNNLKVCFHSGRGTYCLMECLWIRKKVSFADEGTTEACNNFQLT